jgi:glutamyl/glutaminyl-tRNA synthetase
MQPNYAVNLSAETEVVAMQPEVFRLTAFAERLVVKTAEGYSEAAQFLKSIKALLKGIEDARTRVTKPLNEALKQVNAQAKDASAPLATAESQIKRAMIAFDEDQARIRREEQRKADEAARKEQEKLRERAEKAAAAGKVEKAAELVQRAETVVAPVIQREAPKVTGVSMRETWHAECFDLPALVKAIAEGRAPVSLVMANDKVLGAQARSLKADFKCDGVRVWPEKNLGSTAA